jgi:hypothetical protein
MNLSVVGFPSTNRADCHRPQFGLLRLAYVRMVEANQKSVTCGPLSERKRAETMRSASGIDNFPLGSIRSLVLESASGVVGEVIKVVLKGGVFNRLTLGSHKV